MQWRSTGMAFLALSLWAGCDRSSSEPAEAVSPPKSEVLTEHRALKTETPTRQLGEDCTANGASACLSGVCLHVKPGRQDGYVCSQPCQGPTDCPDRWTCSQVYPTPKGRLCTPPRP